MPWTGFVKSIHTMSIKLVKYKIDYAIDGVAATAEVQAINIMEAITFFSFEYRTHPHKITAINPV